MSDTEVEKKGRPGRRNVSKVAETESRKRGQSESPKKAVKNDDSEIPAKRGRGRPKKLNSAPKVKSGRGRGRPKKTEAKKPGSSAKEENESASD